MFKHCGYKNKSRDRSWITATFYWIHPVFVEFIHSGELINIQHTANSDSPSWLQRIDFYIYAIDPSQLKENFFPH